MFYPRYSPDGERVAVHWNRFPRPGVWVISLEDSSQTFVHSGRPKGWTADGRSVYVQDYGSADILLVPLAGGEARVVATVPFETANGADCVTVERPNGLALLCWVDESVSDAWMIEHFDPAVR